MPGIAEILALVLIFSFLLIIAIVMTTVITKNERDKDIEAPYFLGPPTTQVQ